MTPALLLDLAIATALMSARPAALALCLATFGYSEITTPNTPNLIAENAHSPQPPLFSSPCQSSSIRDDPSPQTQRP